MTRFLLVHGAFAGGWIWEPLTPPLEAAGHTVEAPDLPGQGDDHTPIAEVTLDAYAERICEVLRGRPDRAVLVASSMGGVVATQAAARCRGQVAAIVYVAAFVPQDGESLLDLTQLPEGADDQTQANIVVEGDPPVATLPGEIARRTAFAACSDEVAAWALPRRQPQPVLPFTQPVDLEGFDFAGIPRSYVLCTQDQSIPPPLQRRMLETAGCSPVVELDTDHVPHLSRTAELAEILERLAA
jgi:pimeloyl-ACP methyl ester carboxylesterase